MSEPINLPVAKFMEKAQYKNSHTAEDAFILLITGDNIFPDDLTNLHIEFCRKHKLNISLDNFYNLLKSNTQFVNKYKNSILDCAFKCLDKGVNIGTRMSGPFNTTEWISHSLNVAKFCYQKASTMFGVDPLVALKVGLLHDIGRKYSHKFDHIVEGYKYLNSIGWVDEANACLTHSFLKGYRCANNESAIQGCTFLPNKTEVWDQFAIKDDMTKYLEKYNYNVYDNLLCLADLCATSKGIVCPFERILDIATRRPNIDNQANRVFFLDVLTDTLKQFTPASYQSNNNITFESLIEKYPSLKGIENQKLQESYLNLYKASDNFYKYYKVMVKNRQK